MLDFKKLTLVFVLVIVMFSMTSCGITINNGKTISNNTGTNQGQTGQTDNSSYTVVTREINETNLKNSSLVDVIASLKPSVVEVYGSTSSGTSAGSGVAYGYLLEEVPSNYTFAENIEEDDAFLGYTIVTCHHVIKGAYEITVKDISGNSFSAKVIGGDPWSDIAVLSINLKDNSNLIDGKVINPNMKVCAVRKREDVSDDEYVLVGEEVVAIGNPLGTLGGTVTKGIISASERNITVGGKKMNLIQTDCAINSGNSGGGLFCISDGTLVGITNAGYSGEYEGLKFAIPGFDVKEKADSIIKNGYVDGRTSFAVTTPVTTLIGFDSSANYVDYDLVLNTLSSRVGSTNIGAYIYYLNTDRDNIKSNPDLCTLNYNGSSYCYLVGISYKGEELTDIKSASEAIAFIDDLKLEAGEVLTLTIKVGNGEAQNYDITLQQYKYVQPTR